MQHDPTCTYPKILLQEVNYWFLNPFPATIPIDNCVLSAGLDLKKGGGAGGAPEMAPILEARGSQYHLPPPPT